MAIAYRVLRLAPAIVVGLLALAWVVGLFGRATVAFSTSYLHRVSATAADGSLTFCTGLAAAPFPTSWRPFSRFFGPGESMLGHLRYEPHPLAGYRCARLEVPILVLITAVLPLAVGALTRFRFQLRHFFAFVTLFAVELALYLR